MTALRVNESSGSIGSLQIADGYGGFLSGSLVPGTNVTITDDSQGAFTINAVMNASEVVIGTPEDSTYTDGLFKDFSSDTRLGVVIDRFNEILGLLAPAPAENLSEIDNDNSGQNVYLSFGPENSLESEATPYNSVFSLVAPSVDVNELYQSQTSNNNIRIGAFGQPTTLTGTLNQFVAQDGDNYPANAFGNADQGLLKLIINGIEVHQIDLSVFTNSALTEPTGSCFTNITSATPGTLDNGTSFPNFQHRIAGYKIVQDDQEQGWNYARIKHVIGETEYASNYIGWVNDFNAEALTISNTSFSFSGTGQKTLSGVKYYTAGSTTYLSKVDNAYKNVFDLNPSTFSTSTSGNNQGLSLSLPAVSKETIDIENGETQDKSLHLTSSANLNPGYSLGGSITAGTSTSHPFKSSLNNAGQETISGLLIYNITDDSSINYESFKGESHRLLEGNYDNQSDVQSSNFWNSDIHITGSNAGYSNGLQFFDQKLYYPTNTLNSGDFSSLNNGPSNPDYSLLNGNREFLRYFKNTSGNTVKDLKIIINNANTNFSNSESGNNVKVSLKIPGKTGWLDLSSNFVYNNTTDNSGCNAISVDSSNSSTNYATFGLTELLNNEYVVFKLSSSENWGGYIEDITVSFPGGTGTITPVPDLNDIDSNNSGVTGNLSFGESKTIATYTNVNNVAGFNAKDLNESYETPSNNADHRRGIFNGSTVITGKINENIVAVNPDYPADSFSDANTGNLILEVNGDEIHSVDLSVHNSGNTANSGTYFTLSSWSPALFDNSVPDYSEVYRTGTYRIDTSDQDNGMNYARVIHRISGLSDRITNYIEWVNDRNLDALTATTSMSKFEDTDLFYLSGVKYFTSPSGNIRSRVSNIFKNIYSDSSSALSITSTSNCSGTSIVQQGSGLTSNNPFTTNSTVSSLQQLNVTAGSETLDLNVTGSLNYTGGNSIKSSFQSQTGVTLKNCGASLRFKHPLKATLTEQSQATNFLVFQSTDNSTHYNEYFSGEDYRLQSGSYNTQSETTNSSNSWDSEVSINDSNSPDYSSGLLICGGLLMSPKKGGDNGNFRNKYEASEASIFEGPDSNVNYSSLLIDTREYFRYFTNPTTNSLKNIFITIYGDATVVGRTGLYAGTLGSNKNIFVDFKIPGKIEFVDLGVDFTSGAGNTVGQEGDGALAGNFTNSGVVTTSGTQFRTQFSESIFGTTVGSDNLVLRISADKNWTGYIDRVEITWSAS